MLEEMWGNWLIMMRCEVLSFGLDTTLYRCYLQGIAECNGTVSKSMQYDIFFAHNCITIRHSAGSFWPGSRRRTPSESDRTLADLSAKSSLVHDGLNM
jgi:hypothetical protein